MKPTIQPASPVVSTAAAPVVEKPAKVVEQAAEAVVEKGTEAPVVEPWRDLVFKLVQALNGRWKAASGRSVHVDDRVLVVERDRRGRVRRFKFEECAAWAG